MRELEAEVIVKGAGPVGLMLANLLGRHGVRTLVLERNADVGDEPRAVCLDPEGLRALLAADLDEEVLPDLVFPKEVSYVNGRGREFLRVDVSASPYGWGQIAVHIQPLLEQVLKRGLRRFEHVRTLFSHTVEQVGFGSDAAWAEGVDAKGGRFRARANYLVGCGGGRSLVRQTLGIEMSGRSNPQRWLVIDTVDPAMDGWTASRFFCDPRRPHMTLRKAHHHRRWEMMLLPGESADAYATEAAARAFLRPYTKLEDGRILRHKVYTFHSLVADRYREGRLLLCGDAAHMMPPFAGQGMNSGFRDAVNLAWKLRRVLSGASPDSVLDSYEAERRDHVAGQIAISSRLGDIVMPTSRMRAAGRDLVLGAFNASRAGRGMVRKALLAPPKHSRGLYPTPSQPGHGPRVAEMIPQPRVRSGGRSVWFDRALSDGFTLVGLGVDPATSLDAQALAAASRLGAGLIGVGPGLQVEDDEGALLDWGVQKEHRYVLLRPDRFCAAQFSAPEASAALRGVERLLQDV